MRVSSVFASSIRARSLESMTKMSPWVPVASRQHGCSHVECCTASIGVGRNMRGTVACAHVYSPTRNDAGMSQHTREVMPPQRADLVLAADVPDVELGILICDSLDVEADGGDGGDILVKLELVKDGCEGSSQPGLGIERTLQMLPTYSSFQRRRGPASAAASPLIRRSWPWPWIWTRPLWQRGRGDEVGSVWGGACQVVSSRYTRQGVAVMLLSSRQQQLKANGGDWVGRARETCLCFATGQSKRKIRGRGRDGGGERKTQDYTGDGTRRDGARERDRYGVVDAGVCVPKMKVSSRSGVKPEASRLQIPESLQPTKHPCAANGLALDRSIHSLSPHHHRHPQRPPCTQKGGPALCSAWVPAFDCDILGPRVRRSCVASVPADAGTRRYS